jgi:inner membrane protein COX18
MHRATFSLKRSKSLLTRSYIQHYQHRHSIPISISHKKDDANNKPKMLLLSGLPLTVEPNSTAIMTAVSETTTLPAILAMNESIFYQIHNAGLPWWATIVTSTLLLRSSMTLPIAIYQQRAMGKMINLAPMVQSWAETLKVQVAKESQQQGWPYAKYQQELQKQYRKKVKSIYAHHGCARWKILLLPWVQIPLFVSMSLTLRHMTAYPLPWWGQTAETAALGLSEGGLAWFMDLTAVDPTMVVPVMIGAGNLINVEVNTIIALHV